MVQLSIEEWLALVFALLIGVLVGWLFRSGFARSENRRLTDLLQMSERKHEAERARLRADGGERAAALAARASAETAAFEARERAERLAGELAAARAGGGVRAPVLATAPASPAVGDGTARATLSADETLDLDQLKWRNRYLETRVGVLETKISEMASPAVAAGSEKDADDWRRRYSEARIAYLQAKFDAKPATGESMARTESKALWRNRYLEARVRYLEARLTPAPAAQAVDAARSEERR